MGMDGWGVREAEIIKQKTKERENKNLKFRKKMGE